MLTFTEQAPSQNGEFLKEVFGRKLLEGFLLPSMLKMCSPIVAAFSSRPASSDTLKKYLSVGTLAMALISLIKFFVSRAFLFKYPRTLKTEGEEKTATVAVPQCPPQHSLGDC